MHPVWITVILFLVFLLFLAGPLITYFYAKRIAISFKSVKIISHRKDLARYPRLAKIVSLIQSICRTYEIPMPEVGIYPSREINAFATGRPGDSLVAISTGLIKKFTDEEIKGVVAHEVSHLVHKDLRFILLIQGICDLVILVLSWLAFALVAIPRKDEEESSSQQITRFIFAFLIQFIVSFILRIIATAIVCLTIRKRELKADRQGAQMVGYDCMINTLKKLLLLEKKEELLDDFLPEEKTLEDELGFEESQKQTNDYQKEPNSIALLKVSTGKKKSDWILSLFRTHPPLEERITRLKKLKKQRSGF